MNTSLGKSMAIAMPRGRFNLLKIPVAVANNLLRPAGLTISRVPRAPSAQFPDVEPWVAEITKRVRPFTMTSEERISALCQAVRYVVRSRILGDILEFGVWRGG